MLPPEKPKKKISKKKALKFALETLKEMGWKVYILETENNQLYTGITNNIERRIKEHREGRGARFTRIFGFKKLLYTEDYPTRSEALKRESQIKTWPRDKKNALMMAQGQTSRPKKEKR